MGSSEHHTQWQMGSSEHHTQWQMGSSGHHTQWQRAAVGTTRSGNGQQWAPHAVETNSGEHPANGKS
ncbi:hypothetical protein POVWA2_023320 [Plasmodium ovale wallikeri]|uniref:Uncharacterized protein n=1 Tax=Plasmodium ovale wallikeri TaxID=864142 RepID=A0A1A8YUJ5_PLAOA|nr:hypothetical protein POVWA1_023520 [Plasmodium ovale wallikeri]SBT35115.1 hypothetical protein POVWA2_023320 [Plasmodium ovale wallikeri]